MRKLAKADAVLHSLLRRNGVGEKLQNYQFVLRWPEIVGDDLAKVCRPDGIYGQCLMLAVPNSAWSQEIAFRKTIILSRLRPHLRAGQVITELKCRVGDSNR